MRRRTGDGLNPRGRKTNKGGDPRGSHLLAAVRPHEPRGEHHLLVYRLLCHGGRAALRGSVRRAPRTRAVVGGSSQKGINLTRMAFFLCRAISGRRVPARARVRVWVSVWNRDCPAPPRGARTRRRAIVGPNAARRLGAPPRFASVGVDTLGLVRRAHAAASSR